jgi:hypothetical protein
LIAVIEEPLSQIWKMWTSNMTNLILASLRATSGDLSESILEPSFGLAGNLSESVVEPSVGVAVT